MKKFDEWENLQDNNVVGGCNIPEKICDMVWNCAACKALQERGWKAALHCVINMFHTNIMSVDPPHNISEEIESELRN